jgi:hypothetical protein
MEGERPRARASAGRGSGAPESGAQRGLTRREFIAGGLATLAGVAVVGVAAGRAVPSESPSEGLEPPRGLEERDTSAPRPAYGTFVSTAAGGHVAYGHWPPVVEAGAAVRADVCYCLPARRKDPEWLLDGPMGLAALAARSPVAAGPGALLLVAVDGGDTFWHARTRREDRMTMLLEEFIPWFEQRGPGRAAGGARERRAVMGWSMGGYGALLAAERRPDLFGAVAAVSPALWRSYAAAGVGAFDGPGDFRRHDVFAGAAALGNTAVRVDCGTADRFCGAARDFARHCVEQTGRAVAGEFSEGRHHPDYWRGVAPAELAFVRRALDAARLRTG